MLTRSQLEAFAEEQGLSIEQAEALALRMFKRADYRSEYNRRPERVAARKEYNRRPEVKARRREYNRKRWSLEKALRSFSE